MTTTLEIEYSTLTLNPCTLKDMGWEKTRTEPMKWQWRHPDTYVLVQLNISMETGITWSILDGEETEISSTDLELVQWLVQ